jgi:DNA sulfur modification protein DndE
MARLKTSIQTKEILKDIQKRSNLRPNILARIAINLSITSKFSIKDKNYDNEGLEFRRETLFGNYEILFKSLMNYDQNTNLTEENFFPYYTKLYLENGAKLLHSEYEFAGNIDTFLINILDNKVG